MTRLVTILALVQEDLTADARRAHMEKTNKAAIAASE
jgi:hypothetical protein